MLTEQQAVPGTEVVFNGIKKTIILSGSYIDPEKGLMIKTSLHPQGVEAVNFELINGVAVQTQAIVFKGKIVGEVEETIFTPALIAEKSKPLLALKINGVFDIEGAEEVKKAINKAVKMRTCVEGMVDPMMKAINTKAKKDVQAIRDIAQPIYDACYATQNTLQATYDAWTMDVNKAKQKEADEFKAKTEGREATFFEAGMTWNGKAFTGYGKIIDRDYLFGLAQDSYEALLTELQGLQMQAGITGEEQPVIHVTGIEQCHQNTYSAISAERFFTSKSEPPLFNGIIYERAVSVSDVDLRIFITSGVQVELKGALVMNDRINESPYFLQLIQD